ncbi:RbcX protein [Rubidibacter lacunae KORDI 51-2]|uniref:RbcX protein n=1 Tax=Rubidibacter lacunae KORDI 51-2 TaxID=582515 RepID=U5DA05_9CHRO|nr:chaperonin family protein RbcX [Rubidibacter lacunae]ERN41418.1 RbcX protein [Rubidibacter lacunae KORDI 51-2]
MDLDRIVRETAKTLQDYLTYQAVRQIIAQLSETNPPQAIWLRQFSDGSGKFQDSEAYLQSLIVERKDLVLRILTVREHIAERLGDGLMDLVRTRLRESNRVTRCQLLERLTQVQSDSAEPLSEVPPPDAPSAEKPAPEPPTDAARSDDDPPASDGEAAT